jgi:PAS domain S-box-containing protein
MDAKRLRVPLTAASIAYSVLVLLMDIITPLGIEVWVMNLPVLLVPVFLRSTRLVFAANLLCVILVVIGSVMSPLGGNPLSWDILNRGMGVVTMCLISGLAAIIIRRSDALDAARISLERESEAHRKTAQDLEKSVERLRLATEGAGMGAFDVDLEKRKVHFSAAHLNIAGYKSETDLETSIEVWDSWVHPDDLARVRKARELALRDCTPFAIEYRIVKGGENRTIWLADFGRFYYDSAGKGIRLLGVAFDITQRKELERELLGREVLAILSGKQREVGQALHDMVGQELTGLGLMTQSLAARLQENSPEKNVANRIISTIENTHRTIRELSRGLIPVHIETRGIFAALDDLAARVTLQSGVSVTSRYSENIESPDHETATQLFHIAQEAVTNAIRHGRPRNIRLSLLPEPEGLRLRIHDDGNGMPTQSDVNGGLGLRIMQYRAGLIGASWCISTAQNGGTVVTCTLPWSGSCAEKRTQ